MNKEEFLRKLKDDVMGFASKISPVFRFCFLETIKEYKVDSSNGKVSVQVSLFTSQVVNFKEMDRQFYKEIYHSIMDLRILKSDTELERTQFIDFLKLFYLERWMVVTFIKREKPDFCVFDNGKTIGFEITEAITHVDANFRKLVKYNIGRNKTAQEYKFNAEKKHRTYHENFSIKEYKGMIILSSQQGLTNISIIRDKIVESIFRKISIAKTYEKFDENNLIVTFSKIGFDDVIDYQEVQKSLVGMIEQNNFDRIFVSSGLYQALIEYDNFGNLVRFKKDINS